MLNRFSFVFFCCLGVAFGQQSPFFPEHGTPAEYEKIREIETPSSYLVIAMSPGEEDLSTIAYLRIGRGASVSVAFITNGEDVPSDANGDDFHQLASTRKEEAYQTLSYLGAQTYFLNIPPDEFIGLGEPSASSRQLARTIVSRLDTAIGVIQPDAIILESDPLAGGNLSPRLTFLRRLILNELAIGNLDSLWDVRVVYSQTADAHGSTTVPVNRMDRLWSKTYSRIADAAAEFYKSLRFQIKLLSRSQDHRYIQIYPAGPKSQIRFGTGLPGIDRELSTLLPALHPLDSFGRIRQDRKKLEILREAIARVDLFIAKNENKISKTDLRILKTWKLGLEQLRCITMGVSVPFTISDSVITRRQVFLLKFGNLSPVMREGTTRLLFPGVIEKKWIVDEAQNEYYPWKDTTEHTVISPLTIPLNSSESAEGFNALQVRTPLTFIVSHFDPDAAYNFMYWHQIPLIIAPFRSIEVLSPQVVVSRDTEVVVRLKSNVRDRSGGVLYIDDPVVSSTPLSVDLPGKDVMLLDTLHLEWKDTTLSSPHEVQIWAGKDHPVGSIMVHPLNVNADRSRKVGLISVVENSPVYDALRRLGIRAVILGSSGHSLQELDGYSAIIIDRFSFEKLRRAGLKPDGLKRWVENGGHLVVLPQYGAKLTSLLPGAPFQFVYLPIVAGTAKLKLQQTAVVMKSPNGLNLDELDSGLFPVAYGEITGKEMPGTLNLVRAGNKNLLVAEPLGRGVIYYCAVNLYPRLLSVDRSAYELLANLLSN